MARKTTITYLKLARKEPSQLFYLTPEKPPKIKTNADRTSNWSCGLRPDPAGQKLHHNGVKPTLDFIARPITDANTNSWQEWWKLMRKGEDQEEGSNRRGGKTADATGQIIWKPGQNPRWMQTTKTAYPRNGWRHTWNTSKTPPQPLDLMTENLLIKKDELGQSGQLERKTPPRPNWNEPTTQQSKPNSRSTTWSALTMPMHNACKISRSRRNGRKTPAKEEDKRMTG